MRAWTSGIVAITLVALFVTDLSAHGRSRRDGRRHGPRHGLRVPPCVLGKFDANGDGVLRGEEKQAAVNARRAALVEEFDADGDGELSKEERATARATRKAARQEKRAARRAALLEEFDADGDGELSEEEHAAAREAKKAERLARHDTDGDGEISDEERAAAQAARCSRDDVDEEEEEGESVMAALVFSRNFVRGDVNEDTQVDIGDPVGLLGFLFLGRETPLCMDAADGNDDGIVDVSDPTSILRALFLGGAPIPEPTSIPGPDPTIDDLTCDFADFIGT